MIKTYSVTFQMKNGIWITNWHEYFKRDEIDWGEVAEFCKERGYIAYGYYFGHHSRNLTAAKNRVVLWSAAQDVMVRGWLGVGL